MIFHPFDLFLGIVVLAGVYRGRKRGISEELLDVIEWVCIILICAFSYGLLGDLLNTFAKMPILWANLTAYVVMAALVMFLFKSIKRAVGEKLLQGDTFGRMEYYLGMLGGALRFFCVLLFGLAILNAKYSTPAERAATAKMQQDNFGSISFPTIESLQQKIFNDAPTGKLISKHLKFLLIEPKPPGKAGENIGRRRERDVDSIK